MNQDIHSFSQAIAAGHRLGLIAAETAQLVAADARKLNAAADRSCDLFEYFGLRTVYDRYLLRHPTSRDVHRNARLLLPAGRLRAVVEPCGEALELFDLMASHRYMPSSPTLFNSGTPRPQMSSCYLLDSPADDLEGIYARYADVARLSKYAGGIGLAYHRIRSRGSHIRGTNGHSNGVVPWLKTLDSSVAAVNQGGRRKGACAVYLETWHADIEEFLELKDNTGDEAAPDLQPEPRQLGPDLFMQRVEAGEHWSLFDPKVVPHLADLHGEAFDAAYAQAEAAGLAVKQVACPRPVCADDEDAGRDGQWLDELQGRLQPEVEPDAPPRERGSLLEPLHRDRRGDVGRGDGGLQPRLGQPGPPRRRAKASTSTAWRRRPGPLSGSSTRSSTSTSIPRRNRLRRTADGGPSVWA